MFGDCPALIVVVLIVEKRYKNEDEGCVCRFFIVTLQN